MRILHYVDENRLSWGETWIRLINELIKLGADSTVVCKTGGTLASRLDEEGIKHRAFDVPIAWMPWTAVRLGKIIDDIAPDIIHTRLSSAARIGGYWGRRKGIPVVQTVDKYPKAGYHKNADFLIPCSESVREHMHALGYHFESMEVVHNPIDVLRYRRDLNVRSDIRKRLGAEDDRVVITAAGRFVGWKGFDVLLSAYADIISRMPAAAEKTLLLLLGDGEERENLTELAGSAGISSNVVMPGFVDDIRPYLWASDIFVLPSRTPEPFGIVLTEAMASALAPIATKAGGPLDIIEEGVSGWFVDMGDRRALAERLIFAVLNRHEREMVAKEACLRAQCFDVANTARKIIEIYARVLAGSRTPQK